MTPHRRLLRASAAAAALALSLTACSAGATTGGASPEPPAGTPATASPTPTPTARPIKPSGTDAGAWLLPGYAKGLGRTVELAGHHCGVTPDARVILTQSRDDNGLLVTATDLTTGQALWKVPLASCDTGSVDGDVAVIAKATLKGKGVTVAAQRVSAATGEVLASGALPDDLGTLSLIGEDEQLSYLVAHAERSSSVLALRRDGSRAWSHDIGEATYDCELLDGALGCTWTSRDQHLVLDAATGGVRVEPFDATQLAWASDGYVTGDPLSGFVAHDLSGARLEPAPAVAAPRAPGAQNRAHYRIQDLGRGPEVPAVGPQGEPLVVASGTGASFAATGSSLPGFSASSTLHGVTADGSALAYTPSATGTEAVLIGADGTRLASLPVKLSAGRDVALLSQSGGVLLTSKAETVTVHLPAGS